MKDIRQITFGFQRPDAAQTFVVKVYGNGEESAALWTSDSIPIPANGTTGKRGFPVALPTGTDARAHQIEISGTSTSEIQVEWMLIEYSLHGESAGVDIG